jgi:catechol 2,3-dioxygenase-like lactoylglutathione lyase family enzyme
VVQAKFAHTNLIARDWKRLAAFYQRVFGCTPVLPERDLSGSWLDAATNLPGAHIRGIHLRVPGYGDAGPTLEILQYSPAGPESEAAIHRAGYAHIAFQVDDVDSARKEVLAEGGHEFGQLVTTSVPGAGSVTFVYVTDPENNVIELQSWATPRT